jgi:hypothetical protein
VSLESRLHALASAIGVDVKSLGGQIGALRTNPPVPGVLDAGMADGSDDPSGPLQAVVSDDLADLPVGGLLVQTGLGEDGSDYTIWFDDGSL